METKKINWTNVKHDMYGNPRCVCHFIHLLTDKEREDALGNFDLAVSRAVKLGGHRYKGSDFGGGVVFQCYSKKELEKRINQTISDTVRYRYVSDSGDTCYKDFLRIDVQSSKVLGKVKRSIHVNGLLYSYVG